MTGPKIKKKEAITHSDIYILQKLSEGNVTKEIAKERNISYQVVKNYIQEIKYKLEAKSTIHAVVIALRQGIIKL